MVTILLTVERRLPPGKAIRSLMLLALSLLVSTLPLPVVGERVRSSVRRCYCYAVVKINPQISAHFKKRKVLFSFSIDSGEIFRNVSSINELVRRNNVDKLSVMKQEN